VQIHVSVGILIDSHNKILLAQRPNSRSWAGWWEFPGGKIEGNETPHDALKRELKEEIGIEVINCESWTIRNYSYTEHQVTLYFFKITKWTGDPVSNENQRLVWLYPYQVDRKTILPPNIFILNALTMPSYYAITNISETPKRIFYSQLENQLKLKEGQLDIVKQNNAEQEDFLVLFLFEVLEVYSCLKVFDVDRNKFMTFFEKFYKLLILVSFALIKDYLLGEER